MVVGTYYSLGRFGYISTGFRNVENDFYGFPMISSSKLANVILVLQVHKIQEITYWVRDNLILQKSTI